MTVRTPVFRQSGKHQPQTVQKLRARAESASDPRNARTLSERQRSRHIKHFIHRCSFRLCHAASRICRQGLQISSGAFRIEDTESQGRLSGARNACDPYKPVQRYVHIYVLEVMYPGAAHADTGGSVLCIAHVHPSFFSRLLFCRRKHYHPTTKTTAQQSDSSQQNTALYRRCFCICRCRNASEVRFHADHFPLLL